MGKNIGFRSWYYFRQGWSIYFAFIFAAINTLTVTYYLAIDKYPTLQAIFPSFMQYVVIVVAIGVPCLVVIGYVHFKRSAALRSEASVNFESNPYARRNLVNSEINLMLNLRLTEMIIKLTKNEKLDQKEIDEIANLQKKYSEFSNNRKFLDKSDLKFLGEKYKL